MEQLKKGVVPWQKPWDARVSMPRNLITKKEYRGINVLLLLSLAYKSPFWLTYRQVNQLGGQMQSGIRPLLLPTPGRRQQKKTYYQVSPRWPPN